MKKLITGTSLIAILGFAIALANANDVSSENANDAQNYDSQSAIHSGNSNTDRSLDQRAGQVPDINNQGSLPPPELKPEENSILAPTCVDNQGVSLKKNDSGYIHCRNMEKIRQMN